MGDGGVGDSGGGGEEHPNVMFKPVSLSAPRSFSGVESSFEADCCVSAVPLFLERTAALLLARDAANTAFALFIASGLALYTWTRADGVADDGCIFSGEGDAAGGEVDSIISAAVATPGVGVSEGERFSSASLLLSSRRLLLLAFSSPLP